MRLELSWQMIRPGELRITDLACAKPPQAVADAVLDAYGLRIDNEASESINDEAIAEFANAPLPEPPTGVAHLAVGKRGPSSIHPAPLRSTVTKMAAPGSSPPAGPACVASAAMASVSKQPPYRAPQI